MTVSDFITQDLTKSRVSKQDLIAHGVIEENKALCVRETLPRNNTAIRDLTLATYEDYAESLGEYWQVRFPKFDT
jgi:hypothetical protein